MSYLIERKHDNGYRCPCCVSVWDCDDKWTEDRVEALAAIPHDPPSNGEFGGYKSIRILDGSNNGVEIARGEVSWPEDCGRSHYYAHTRWEGYRTLDDGTVEKFDRVFKGDTEIDTPWAEIITELRGQLQRKKIEKAERDLQEAKERLEEGTS